MTIIVVAVTLAEKLPPKDPMSYKVENMVEKDYFESEEQKVFKRAPPGADMYHGKEAWC